jgi:hypothetical protein
MTNPLVEVIEPESEQCSDNIQRRNGLKMNLPTTALQASRQHVG